MSPLARFLNLFKSPTQSRTLGILIVLILLAAVPLTVFVSKQQQEIRQRAATSNQCNAAGLETGSCADRLPSQTCPPPGNPPAQWYPDSQYVWKAVDCGKTCNTNEDCPSNPSIITTPTAWCYGFDCDGQNGCQKSCLQLQESGNTPPTSTPPPGTVCQIDQDCYDGKECTLDKCNETSCTHTNHKAGIFCGDFDPKTGKFNGTCDGLGNCNTSNPSPTGGTTCPVANSLQSRYQLNSSDPWGQSKTSAVGQTVNAAVFKNGTSTFAGSGVTASITGPGTNKTINTSTSNPFTPSQPGTYALKAVCGGLSDSATLTVGSGTAPACDPAKVTMTVKPNPGINGQNMTFGLSGTQGSTWVGDTWSSGVNCSGGFWGEKNCQATSAGGSFTWTHSWRNCISESDASKIENCPVQCSKTQTYNINAAGTSCDPSKLQMSLSPSNSSAGDLLTFSLSGSQGSTNPGDEFSPQGGGVNWGSDCEFPLQWPLSARCTAKNGGAYNWTHTWRNCLDGEACKTKDPPDSMPPCKSSPVSYTIAGATGGTEYTCARCSANYDYTFVDYKSTTSDCFNPVDGSQQYKCDCSCGEESTLGGDFGNCREICTAPQASGSTITASPNPVSIIPGELYGTTTITWNAKNTSKASVCVDTGSGESLFARALSGSQNATWISTEYIYTFRLRAGENCETGSILASVDVKTTPGQKMYFCKTADYSCSQTSWSYTNIPSCESSLGIHLPGQTTGSCYTTSANCEANCGDTSQCKSNYDCPPGNICIGGFCEAPVITNTPTPTIRITGTPTARPTSTPTPRITSTPTPLSTVTPTSTPRPTSTPTPRITSIPTLTPTVTPTPRITSIPTLTPTVTPNGTMLAFNLKLSGIGSGNGQNPNPVHTTRNITVCLYNPTVSPTGDNNCAKAALKKTGTATFNSSSGNFVNNNFDLGLFNSGSFQILIKSDMYLRKRVPVIVNIVSGQVNQVPEISLIVGDINNDNLLNIQDYNVYVSCFGDKANTTSCADKNAVDLNDDGKTDVPTDLSDYRLLFSSFQTQFGD